MLAISTAPLAPHLLPRLDPIDTLSILPSEPLPNRVSMTSMSSQRPKLSLKTSDLAPTYVGSTPSRSTVATSTTTTPTTLNTFTNTFELTYRPSPSSAIPSPGPSLSRRPTLPQSSLYTLNLPYGVHSILKNSPLPPDVRRSSLATASASPRISNRRVFFPAPKKVTFKPVLEEEIVTTEYVARHADLSSSSEDDTSSSESESPSQISSQQSGDKFGHDGIRVDEVSPRGRRKRKSSAASEISSEEDRGREERSRSTSERRTKRKKRRWEWTIPAESTSSTPVKGISESDGNNEKSGEQPTEED